MSLLDELLKKVSKKELTPTESAVLSQLSEEEDAKTKTAEQVYVEHNGDDPHSAPGEQCQCAVCKGYRGEK